MLCRYSLAELLLCILVSYANKDEAMSIRIELPNQGESIKSVYGTKVFTECGTEIKNVTRIEINIEPNDILCAVITVPICEVLGLDGIMPCLSKDVIEQIEALGYEINRK